MKNCSLPSDTVGKIYTPIFGFSKRVVYIAFFELRSLSNERYGNLTFYRGIHEFIDSFIFEKITVFLNSMLQWPFHRKFCEIKVIA